MPDNTISELTEEQYAVAESQVIGLIREARPELDLRIGTALRDLAVRTVSQVVGVSSQDIEDLRSQMSFKLLSENPELATEDVVESLASNYNIVRRAGVAASGYMTVNLSKDEETALPEDYRLGRGDLEYTTEQVWKLRHNPTESNELTIYTDETGSSFVLLPVVAKAVGVDSNAKADESFEVIDPSVAFVLSASSYSDIQGGQDQESVESLLTRIEEAMSHRELTSENAITTRLQNDYPELIAASVTGMGDAEMLRDKHNVFGVAVGSRVDVFCKTFTEPVRQTIILTATKVDVGIYSFVLTPDETGVIYHIAGVTSPSSLLTTESEEQAGPILGSYPFTEERYIMSSDALSHDISSDPAQAIIETAYSKYQATVVNVTDIGAVQGSYPDTIELRVDVYVAPRVDSIQDYLDAESARNREADILARGAIPAFVSATIPVYRSASVSLDIDAMRTALASYINDKTFGEDLTLSQINAVLHKFNIIKVGTDDPDLVTRADVRAANGQVLSMTGTELKISSIADPSIQVTKETTLFVADLSNIFIEERVI